MTYTHESDLNHNNPLDPAHRYACYNKPNSAKTVAWLNYKVVRGIQKIEPVTTEWLDIKCGHSYRKTDPCCSNCKWR